jgi:tRNA U34 5-methylaminomethyl-2-thiouridine-forming methyltransferase MnmC
MIQLIPTEDGSYTLKNELLDETYHSTKGAFTESQHVFVEEGMMFQWQRQQPAPVHVLEIGFGTGFNALLSIQAAEAHGVPLHYVGLEPYPVPSHLIAQMQLLHEQQRLLDLHLLPWEIENTLKNDVKLQKLQITLEGFKHPYNTFDVVYFDAFAPKKQPELWAPNMLQKCFDLLRKNGVLVTYCANGQFKRDLKSVGFRVEKVQGPPGGKREMTRAYKD